MARKSRKAAPTAAEVPVNGAAQFQVGIYTRLSVESTHNRESDSLLHQRELCLDYLKDKPDMALVDTYMDDGFTGTNFERVEFQRMLGDIQSKRINCVLVKDLSRFGRNYLEVDQYLNIRFPEWKVRFIAVLDHFDTAVPDKEGHLIVPFRNILNEYYSRDFSMKVRSAIRAKMKNGTFVGNFVNIPYGYVRDGENHTYQINPETAPVLQRIFQMRLNGHSYYRIATTLNDEGIPSPFRYLYLKGCSSTDRYRTAIWTYSSVRQILNNRAYLGVRIHHKTESGLRGANRRFVARDQQIWIEQAHEPLVSQEDFDAVQKLNQESARRQRSLKTTAPDCDFRPGLGGRTFCGDCGSTIYYLPSKMAGNRTILYTRCSRFLKYAKACTIHSIQVPKLVEVIDHALRQQMSLSSAVEDALKKMSSSEEGKQTRLNQKKRSLLVRKNNINERKNQLLKDYMSHILNREEFFLLKEQYEAQSSQLEKELADVQQEISEMQSLAENARDWLRTIHEYEQRQSITNELIQDLVERVDLYQKGKSVEVKLTFRFQNTFQQIIGEAESHD